MNLRRRRQLGPHKAEVVEHAITAMVILRVILNALGKKNNSNSTILLAISKDDQYLSNLYSNTIYVLNMRS